MIATAEGAEDSEDNSPKALPSGDALQDLRP
jgi:hypothetical protein